MAEDNLLNQKITVKTLQNLGYETIIANNGQETLDVLQANTNSIALILMDCRMPVVDGFMATRQIRQLNHKIKDIPIIALTANAGDDEREECLAAGMNDFLAKPFNKEALNILLEKHLNPTQQPNITNTDR